MEMIYAILPGWLPHLGNIKGYVNALSLSSSFILAA